MMRSLLQDYLKKRKRTLDENLVLKFMDEYSPADVELLLQVFKKYKVSTIIFQRCIEILKELLDKDYKYLNSNLVDLSILIAVISRYIEESQHSLIPKLSLLNYLMICTEQHILSIDILNGMLACTHLLSLGTLDEIINYKDLFSDCINNIRKEQIDKVRSRIIFNIIKLANRWKNSIHFEQFLTAMNQIDIFELKGIDHEKFIELVLKIYKLAHHHVDTCVIKVLCFTLTNSNALQDVLEVVKHRRISKQKSNELANALFKYKMIEFYKNFSVDSHLAEFRLLLIVFANLTHSIVGCSLIFNFTGKLLKDIDEFVRHDVGKSADIILATTSIFKRLIGYSRHRLPIPELYKIIEYSHQVLNSGYLYINNESQASCKEDKVMKHTIFNVIDVFKSIKNANIDLNYCPSIKLFPLAIQLLRKSNIPQPRRDFFAKRMFDIVSIYCTTSNTVKDFFSVSENVEQLFNYYYISTNSMRKKIKTLLARLILIITRTGIEAFKNSFFFYNLAKAECQNCILVSDSLYNFLKTEVFLISNEVPPDCPIFKNAESAITYSLIHPAFNPKREYLLECLENVLEKNEKSNILFYFQVHCKYSNKSLDDLDNFIDISMVNQLQNDFFENAENIAIELEFIDNLDLSSLLDLAMYCDMYAVPDGITVCHYIVAQINSSNILYALMCLSDYNPLLLETNTCFSFLLNRILKMGLYEFPKLIGQPKWEEFYNAVPKSTLMAIIMNCLNLSQTIS
eukprot:NODE_401_length_8090_cov_0.333876.p2 type:complete len:741 gc:universal NODE_401_length_8090_cov_0.333876:2387-4609(+)